MIYKANSLVIQINKISFRNMGFVFLPTLKQEFTEVPCCIACYAQVGKKVSYNPYGPLSSLFISGSSNKHFIAFELMKLS